MIRPYYINCPECGGKNTVKVFDCDMWSDYRCINDDCDYYKMVEYYE